MPFEEKEISLDEVKNDRPINQLFTEALIAYYESDDQAAYPVRTVAARLIRIPGGFEADPANLAMMRPQFAEIRRRHEHPATPPICVIERADGSLWSYDDVHTIALFHELAPVAFLRVVIIGFDPTPGTVA